MSKMKKILSYQEQKILLLIETLDIYENLSFTKLQEFVEVDPKTLRRLIQRANQFFSPIQIKTDSSNLFSLSIPSNLTIKYCYSIILEGSLEFNIIEEIFFNETHSISSLSQKLFISESTLRRTISKINTILYNQGFKIKTLPLRIRGDEQRIINFIIYFLMEKYSEPERKFSLSKRHFVDHLISLHFKITRKTQSYPDIYKGRIWLLVILERIKTRGEVNLPIPKKNIPNGKFLRTFHTLFKQNFNIDIKNNPYFLFFYGTYKTTFLRTKRSRLKKKYQFQKRSLLQLFSLIQGRLAIPEPTNKQKLLDALDITIKLHSGPPFVLLDNYELFIKKFKLQYPFITETILKTITEIFSFLEEYQVYSIAYMIITHWEDFILSITYKMNRIPLALLFNSDIEHMNMLKILIEEKFPRRFDINILSSFIRTDNLNFSNLPYALILTNIENLNVDDKCVYCTELFLNDKDWNFLSDYHKNFDSLSIRSDE